LRLSYGDRELLIDPMLDAAGSWPAVELLLNPQPNPVAELPKPAEEVVEGIDGVLLTHLHLDHFDLRARELIPRGTPVFHQAPDRKRLEQDGFEQLTAAADAGPFEWLGLEVRRVGGEHGFGSVGRAAGPVSGYVLRSEGEPTLYIAGDTVWCEEVESTLGEHRPDVVIVNAGDARTADKSRLIMDADDVERVLDAAERSAVVAVHLEALSHCLATREELRRRFADGYGSRFVAPDDGGRHTFMAA
jgi:L-ascorbate metabolism protein UlaG (beta-lactamase superfamily)